MPKVNYNKYIKLIIAIILISFGTACKSLTPPKWDMSAGNPLLWRTITFYFLICLVGILTKFISEDNRLPKEKRYGTLFNSVVGTVSGIGIFIISIILFPLATLLILAILALLGYALSGEALSISFTFMLLILLTLAILVALGLSVKMWTDIEIDLDSTKRRIKAFISLILSGIGFYLSARDIYQLFF
jgi:amino acid transporter